VTELTRPPPPAMMLVMAERNLQIARFIGEIPSLAYCDVCRLTFRTRQEFLLNLEQARQQLRSDFEKHECKPQQQAVDDALEHIR
jgi:uncharacterized protein (DUF849 family)